MKRDNNGFSLVELIVVVLIMAIVALALAPQVMKWVQNSRISSDIQTKADLEKACVLAITDEDAFECVKEGGYEIIISKSGNTISFEYNIKDLSGNISNFPSGSHPTPDAFWNSLFDVLGVSTFSDFENRFTIKSTPTDGPKVVIDVHVYEGGYTFSSMSGVTSDTFQLN